MTPETETLTYRGESLDDLLPRIREELGSDAVIVRQREGIVGGIGGFFGKKCVEVEARPSPARPSPSRSTAPRPAVPPRAVIDAYDTGDEQPEAQREPEAHGEPLFEALMAQTSPFVEHLADALDRLPEEPPARVEAPILQDVEAPRLPDVQAPTLPDVAPRVEKPARFDDFRAADAAPAVRAAFAAAGIPPDLEEEIVTEVEQALRPFEPLTSFRELARRSLTRRLKVSHGWRTKRRTIAVIGLPGSGRTLAAAKLCHAYSRAGRSVSALSLESPRNAARFIELTERTGVGLEIADSPQAVALARKRLRSSEILVVDTPAIPERIDGRRLGPTLRLLDALKPDETHLLIPAAADPAATRAFLSALTKHIEPTRILITHADQRPHTGVAVGVSLTDNWPISFVGEGDRAASGLVPAEPADLARMVLS